MMTQLSSQAGPGDAVPPGVAPDRHLPAPLRPGFPDRTASDGRTVESAAGTRASLAAIAAVSLALVGGGAASGAAHADAAPPASPGVGIDLSAPVIARHEVVIAAPVAVVWAAQVDIDAWPSWRPSVSRARLDGPLAPGAVFRWEEAGLDITSTVLEVVPERRIAWTGPAQGIVAVHVWEFTPVAGGTRVHTEESWAGPAVDGQAEALQPLLDEALDEWLMRLKARSEAVAGAAPEPGP